MLHPLAVEHWESGVEQLLNQLNPWLEKNWLTRLVAAKDEPFYQPKSPEQPYHQIQFAHGYFNSALHELAHWSIAGEQRRLLDDYGYWYEPDGRSAEQQACFERVEVKPQAIEWFFAQACGRPFRLSVDNLSLIEPDNDSFQRAVVQQAQVYQAIGLPARAQKIQKLLCDGFGQSADDFCFSDDYFNE